MLKKVLSFILVFTMVVTMFCGCSNTQNTQVTEKETAITTENANNVETRATIYRTAEEWKERWKVPEYHPNKEITGEYDKTLAAKCINGTFVGQLLENNQVKAWRGIPFGKIPARFQRAVMPDASDKVYEALYFGKSFLQNGSEDEPGGLYEQGEFDAMTLTVYSGNNDLKNKPVFVYVHGGGYVCGGTADPLYEPINLAYYMPDCVFVNVTYRLGVLGHINLAAKDENGNYLLKDYAENEDVYNTANNLAILDVIQSLRWVKENIEAFGGDPDNVTIGGESAGAGMVSNILMITSDPNNHYVSKDEKLFKKVISMSGGINQYSSTENAADLTKAMINLCKQNGMEGNTIKDLQELTFDEISEFWKKNELLGVLSVLDGVVLPLDPYETYNKYVGNDFTVLQGATTDEFDYYRIVFKSIYKSMGITHDDSGKALYKHLTDSATDTFKEDMAVYMEEIKKEGFVTEEEQRNTLMNDHFLQSTNYYMATKQAEKGGTTYCYAFNEPYTGDYAMCKAGHAVDCYYFFGIFNGDKAIGTKEQVDFSRKYQKMFENFLKTDNPSTEDVEWKPYNAETGYITLLNKEKIECIKGYNAERIRLVIKMIDESEVMRYAYPFKFMLPLAAELSKAKP